MYIPPNFNLETEHLDTLLKQLHSPYILVGDFNGQNILWGCKDNNPKGNIEDFITNKNSAEGVIAPAGAKVTGATIRMWLLNKFISYLAVLTWKTGLK